jgi:hypothetical protein
MEANAFLKSGVDMSVAQIAISNRLNMKNIVRMLIISCLLFWICESQAGRIKRKHFFEHGDEIHFKMGGQEFRIKKGYFRGGSQTHWGAISYTRFWALLPDFEIYDKKKNYDEFVTQLGHGRRIRFMIHPSHEGRASLSRLFELGKTSGFRNYSHRIDHFDEKKYGLEIYRSGNKSDDDYLYRPDGNELEVYLRCRSSKANLPSPSCKMFWDYTDTVYAEATFSMDYLPIWQEIVNNIELILQGQEIEAQGENDGIAYH